MGSAYPQYPLDPYVMPAPRRSFFPDDDDLLEDNILEQSNLLEAPLDFAVMDRRRGGASLEATFSPTTDGWEFDHDMMGAGPADDSTAVPAVTFEHSSGTNNPFIKLEQAQPAYAQQHGWGASGACTPSVYDNNNTFNAYDDVYVPSMGGAVVSAQGPFDNNGSNGSNMHIQPHNVFTAANGSIPSTPTVKDWAPGSNNNNNNSSNNNNGAGPADHDPPSMANKRMQRQTSPARAHSPLHNIRRDGIRKKNARFDIPAERTLMNIDQLIARSQDENEIKELKQQKRLLRNRQAALDSRQRKKQHTERLEEEKKLHGNIIQELEDKIHQMTLQEDALRSRFSQERDYFHQQVETLQMEKENLVRNHTLESGDLRKKNSFLQEEVHRLQDQLGRTSMVHQESSSGFSDAFEFESEFDLDGNCWDEPMLQIPTVKAEKVAPLADSEKAAAPGLLLILLLVGALVASSKTASPSLPPLPKHLQTASASVLQNIFQDAGVNEITRSGPIDTSSSDSWIVAKSDVPHMIGLESTMSVLNSLDKATPEQQREQLMQLSAAEYNDVTSNNFLREPEPVNRSRRRIHDNLANMRNSKPNAAEVYTRSLMWDRVDAEVVRRFAAFARQAQTSGASGNEESSGAAAHS